MSSGAVTSQRTLRRRDRNEDPVLHHEASVFVDERERQAFEVDIAAVSQLFSNRLGFDFCEDLRVRRPVGERAIEEARCALFDGQAGLRAALIFEVGYLAGSVVFTQKSEDVNTG